MNAGFIEGGKAVSPLLIGVVPFGLVFGVVAADSVAGPALGYATSLIIFAGAAQFATIGLFEQDAAAVVIIATALVINSRHIMYSAALAPHFREFPGWSRYALPYLMTDQAFAVSIVRYREVADPAYKRWFFTGAGLALWAVWQATTLTGALLGTRLPESLSLEFAIPLVFLALLVLTVTNRPELVAAVTGGAVALLASSAPYGLGLIAGALSGVVAGVVAARVLR